MNNNTIYSGILTANDDITKVTYTVLSTSLLGVNFSIFYLDDGVNLVSDISILYSSVAPFGTFINTVNGVKDMFSVNQTLTITVNPPIPPYHTAKSITTSALVCSTTIINLQGQLLEDGNLTYQIIQESQYRILTEVSKGIYNYTPISNLPDSFLYTVTEGIFISLPGTVTIINYNEADINSIPKQQGTWYFNNISFNGYQWRLGNFISDSFLQFPYYSVLGSTLIFYK